MTTSEGFFPKVQPGDPLLAEDWNDVTSRLMKLSNVGGGSSDVLSNSVGTFVRKKRNPEIFWRARLSEDLDAATNYLSGPTSAECDFVIRPTGSDGNYESIAPSENLTVYNYDKYAIYANDEIVAGIVVRGRYVIKWPGPRILLGSADADVGAGTSGTFSIDATTSINVTAFARVDIESGAKCSIIPRPDVDIWEAVPIVGDGGEIDVLGKADAAISKGSSGTVSVWSGTPGSETDTTDDITAYARFGAVLEDAWVWCAHNGDGWYITATDCGSGS